MTQRASRAPAIAVAIVVAVAVIGAVLFARQGADDETRKAEAARVAAEAKLREETDKRAKAEALAREEGEKRSKLEAEAEAAKKADEARRAARKPGAVFRDCPDCARMVVIAAGEFTMGSPGSEAGRDNDEGPQHMVRIAQPFAMGRSEVTVGEFRRFVRDTGRTVTGCRVFDGTKWNTESNRNWDAPGFAQSDDHPVACVSWQDATAYAQWLSKGTGKKYRLPTEAEWEYAARGGSRTARFWGDSPNDACAYANVTDQTGKRQLAGWTIRDCDDGNAYTAPVASKRPNAFGLYDMLGNVWEWTEDCWNGSYNGAPSDGSAWLAGNCSARVLRGGSWYDDPRYVRSAGRSRGAAGVRSADLGFRLARTLE